MGATTKGYPYPDGGDANDVPGDMAALCAVIDSNPGVASMSTATRDGLSGGDLWAGRTIYNTTTSTMQRYTGAAWVTVYDSSATIAQSGVTNLVTDLAAKASTASLATKADLTHTHAVSDLTSGTLPVARGGTGVATSTGTGSNVLSGSPTFTGTAEFAAISIGGVTFSGYWTAYTPVVGGTGWAIGNGTITGSYLQIGKTVIVRVSIDWGSTSTFGAGALTITTPTGAVRYETEAVCRLYDVGVGNYAGWATFNATSELINVYAIATPSSYAVYEDVVQGVPFTWANGDGIRITGIYETT